MRFGVIAALSLWAMGAFCVAEEFAPGKETRLPWEGLADPIEVYVPTNYETEVAAPVIFYYHGTNGRPNLGNLPGYTGGRDFVIVGMTYLKRGNLDGSEANLRAELDQLVAVRDHLAERLSIDERRVYIAGFSKGGWLASMVSEFGLGRIRGALIMGAGVTARAEDRRPAAARKRPAGSHPIYVGIGQWDGNFMMSLRCIRHFSEIGGAVTFDIFRGLAHSGPYQGERANPSDYLVQWLAVEAAGGDGDRATKAATGWWMKRRAQLGKLEPLERYLLLKHVSRAPFHRLLGAEAKAEITGATERLRGDPALEDELAVEENYLALLGSEIGDATTAGLTAALKKYRELALASPDTHFGKEAFMQWRRCHLLASNSVSRPLPGVAEIPEFKAFAKFVAESEPDGERAAEVERYFRSLGGRLYRAP